MKTYENQMFKFYSTHENFNIMVQVVDDFENVKNQLVRDFWHAVLAQLNHLNKSRKGKELWTFSSTDDENIIPQDIDVHKGKWGLDENDNPPLSVYWIDFDSTPSIGLWVNTHFKSMDVKKMVAYAKSIDIIQRDNFIVEEKNQGFYFYLLDNKIDFKKHSDLKKILPQNRKGLVEEYASRLFTLANKLEKDMDKMAMMKKKVKRK